MKKKREDNSIPKLNFDKIKEHSVDLYIRRFVHNNELPPQDMRSSILKTLNKKKTQAISSGKYREADQYYTLYKDILSAYTKYNARRRKSRETRKQPDKNITNISEKLEKTRQEYEDAVNELFYQRKLSYDVLLAQHKQQKEEFNQYWATKKAQHHFVKPSYQLQQLREKERRLILIKDYNRAADIKERADDLEKIEREQAREKVIGAMRNAYSQLLVKQNNEVSIFNQNTALQKEEIDKKYINLIEPMEKALKWQGMELDEKIRKSSPTKIYDTARILYPPEETDFFSRPATPRTKQAINEYRSKAIVSELKFEQIDVNAELKKMFG